MTVLNYGEGLRLELTIDPSAVTGSFEGPQGDLWSDPAAALIAALDDPLDFPAFEKAVAPGDRVTIAVGEGLPRAEQLIPALVEWLVDAGASREEMIVLCTDASRELAERLEEMSQTVSDPLFTVEVHDPNDRSRLSHLAADDDGEPILVNRRLFDADLVVPIGCVRDAGTRGYGGVNGCLFPAFSDAACSGRFQRQWLDKGQGRNRASSTHEADEATWLLGAIFTIQVVPGRDGEVLHVIAGQGPAVREHAQQLNREAWRFEGVERADLVIASVTGSRGQDVWAAIGSALDVATRLVQDGGAIALCTDVHEEPSPTLREMVGAEELARSIQTIRSESPPDAVPALQLAEALEQARVYLVSHLDEAIVEDLGMVHVDEPGDLSRLASRSGSCLIVPDAPYVVLHSGVE